MGVCRRAALYPARKERKTLPRSLSNWRILNCQCLRGKIKEIHSRRKK